ncbi:hypothetical protein WME97_12135 [Sorangium sp. So ce367]|uniref:hypothetical protein n=1 Tax=Sorangium sp. So ce367 TaxID=3133305 RepID=UPI003F5E520D
MQSERKPREPWNEETFFSEAEARSAIGALGLRRLFDEAMSLVDDLDIVWGTGDVEARFIIRQAGSSAGDLVSGWASGQVQVYVAILRDMLREEQRRLDEVAAALGRPDWSEAKEPFFDAELLEQRQVAAAIHNLLASMAGLGKAAVAIS